MTIDEVKVEVRKIEKYYDYNHQVNDYDVLVNLTEIANLILLQNKTSSTKAIDDFKSEDKDLINNSTVIRHKDVDEIAEQLKVGGKE